MWAIVVAAGEGRRFGRPKQFEVIGERLVLEWAVESARSVADGVVLVLPPSRVCDEHCHGGADVVVAGGEQRADSVRAGLSALPDDAKFVLVHDAARPLASPALFRAVLAALAGDCDGAIPALAVSDTIKRVDADGSVIATLDRSELVAVQTPQGFRTEILRKAHASGAGATDDAALLEAIGARVVTVPGEAHNLKITNEDDLAFVARHLAERRIDG